MFLYEKQAGNNLFIYAKFLNEPMACTCPFKALTFQISGKLITGAFQRHLHCKKNRKFRCNKSQITLIQMQQKSNHAGLKKFQSNDPLNFSFIVLKISSL